jgi:hypothetical protein
MIISQLVFADEVEIGNVPLPGFWEVKLDPDNVGLQEKWFGPKLEGDKSKDWKPISTHKWLGWDKQGMPEHIGFAWYRVRAWIPGSLQKKFTYLYFGAVDEETQLWVNGQSAGEHTCASESLTPVQMWDRPFFLDITKFVRFEDTNQFTVRVHNSAAMGGVWQPVYIFTSDTKVALTEMKKQADILNQKIQKTTDESVRYEVWTTDDAYEPVFPDAKAPEKSDAEKKPQDGSWARNIAGTIKVRGASGELIPLALHVRNRGKSALPIRLHFDRIRHEKDSAFMLNSERIDLFLVDFVLQPTKDIVPDPLPRAGGANNIQISPDETISYFATIDTEGMPAGVYKGEIYLTPLRTGPILQIPFELTIEPVVLPEEVPIWVTVWTYDPRWLCSNDLGRGSAEPYYELMRRTGINCFLTRNYELPRPVLDDSGNLTGINTIDFDQSLVDWKFDPKKHFLVLGLLLEHNKHYWGSDISTGDDKVDGKPKDLHISEQWKNNFIKYVKMLSNHIQNNVGIPYEHWALYLMDERIYESEGFVDFGKFTREADPKIRIWANSLVGIDIVKKAEPYIDIFVPAIYTIPSHPESVEYMRQKGKEWWIYENAGSQEPGRTAVPRNDPYSPHRKLRMHGWNAWKLDLKGLGYWIYIGKWWGRYSGFDESTPKYADCSFIYLGHDGPVTSRRLEAYREGLEDYKLLWVVDRSAKAEGQSTDLVKNAKGHIQTAVEEVLAQPRKSETLLRWQNILLDDAKNLCESAPLEVKVSEIITTKNSATLKLSTSKPVRVWVWHRSEGASSPIQDRNFRLVNSALEQSTAPVITIDGLVPNQRSEVTLVVAGPEGQQKLLRQEFRTEGW